MSDELLMTTEEAAEAFESVLGGELRAEPGLAESMSEDPATEEEDEDPSAAEEAEEEPDEEPDEGEEDEEDAEEELGARYRVVVNGEEREVELQELINGYQRQSDYTKKTQQLAAERQQNQQLVNEYSQRISELLQFSQQLQQAPEIPEPNIDWQRLQAEDPVEWTRQRILAQDRATLRAQRQAKLQELQAQQQQLQQAQFQTALSEQKTRLLELIPEWRDPKVAEREKAQLREFAMEHFKMSQNDVDTAYDARLVHMLRLAYMYHSGTQKAKKAVRPAPERNARTQGRSYSPESEKASIRKAQQRLARSGSIEDAEQVFAKMFG